jgi:hypothetical protein
MWRWSGNSQVGVSCLFNIWPKRDEITKEWEQDLYSLSNNVRVWDYWVFGLCLSFGILKAQHFGNCISCCRFFFGWLIIIHLVQKLHYQIQKFISMLITAYCWTPSWEIHSRLYHHNLFLYDLYSSVCIAMGWTSRVRFTARARFFSNLSHWHFEVYSYI